MSAVVERYDLPDGLSVSADRDARVVVLTGAGRAFSAGGDLGWITTFLDDPVARDESIREGAQIIEEMLRFPLPVIAGAALWPLLTPIMRSREFLYTGDRVDAAKAVELGLASRTVATGELHSEAMALAHRLAEQPVEALQGTKRVVNMHLSQVLSGPLQAGFAAEQVSMRSEDHRERLLAVKKKTQK